MPLSLTRKAGQSFYVGDALVEIVSVDGRGNVRLAVTAPPSTAIVRTELLERITATPEVAERIEKRLKEVNGG